jgi:hypothetical protein
VTDRDHRDLFALMDQEVPTVVDRFLRERAGGAGRKDPSA